MVLKSLFAAAILAVVGLLTSAASYAKDNWQPLALGSFLLFGVNAGFIDPLAASSIMFLVVKTAAGTIISISANIPATFNQAGYENSNVIFTAIGEITDGGAHGRKYNEITHLPLASRGVQKFKGSFNEGNKTLQLGLDSDDAGQIIAKQALDSDNNYSFKVAYPGGDIDYFQAKVMSYEKGTANSDSIVTATIELALQANSSGIGVVEYLAP